MIRFATLFVATTCLLLLACPDASAGISYRPLGYNVSQGTYSEITGGTVLATGDNIDSYSAVVTLPFTINWNGTNYSTVEVSGKGYVDFIPYGDASSNNLPGNGAVVSAWYNDLTGTATGEMMTATLGTSPNQVFVIQWKNTTRAPQGSSDDVYNFQIRLNQATGQAEIVYGTMTIAAAVGAQIGCSAYNGDEIAFTVSYWHNDWMHPYTNMDMESMALTNWGPASGTTYTVGAASSADARVSRVTSPVGKFNASTNQTVKVVFVNAGANPMDSLEIGWAVNGVSRGTMRYYANPQLQPGDEIEVTLGTVNFNSGTLNKITAWTSSPNGVLDQCPGNDELSFYLAPRVSGRLNLALSGNPGVFASFRDCFRHLVNSGISGNTNVHVFNGNYNEQILVPQIDNALNGGIVTIQNAANNAPTIVWAPSDSPEGFYGSYEYDFAQLTVLDMASIAIDGLKFTLPSGLNWGGHILGEQTGSVVIKNSTCTGPKNYTTIASPSYAINVSGGPFTITDNTITNVPLGLNLNGTTTSADVIRGNTITNFVETGAQISSSNVDVNGNTLTSALGASNYCYGLGVSGAGWLRNNQVYVDVTTKDNSYGVGIESVSSYGYQSGPHSLLVYNNMVSVGATGTAVGLVCQPDAGQTTTKLYNNSVYITGSSEATSSTAAYIPLTGPIDLVNNIFDNYGTGTGAGYALFFDDYGVVGAVHTMDFNNYMTTGTYIGYFNGDIARNTVGNPLTDWRTATGKDNNSSSVVPSFYSSTDLHLRSIQSTLYGSAATLSVVSTDIDGDTRFKPYMGADEVQPTVEVLESPQSRYACLGESFQLMCVAKTTPGATTTYQWYKDGRKLQGSTGSILVMNSVGYPTSGSYTCIVVSTDGSSTVSDTSDAATIIVVRNTSIVTQPLSQPTSIGASTTLMIEAEAIGAPNDFVPTYQWKKHFWSVVNNAYVDTNVVDDRHITGSKSSRLTITNITSKDTMDTYVCEVVGYCGTAVTKQARLYIPVVAASTSTPIACEGGPINAEVLVQPESIPGSTLEYQWYRNTTALQNSARVTGANGKALRITNATAADAGTYHCVITYNGADVSITSNDVTVTMGTTPVISAQPKGDTVCVGAMLTLTTTANGGGLQYQWYKGTTSIPGAVGQAYIVQAASEGDSGTYSVVVSNLCGSATSEVVDVAVSRAVRILTQPTDVAIYDGDTLRMSVEVSGSEPITYQWYHDTTMIVGATEATYMVDSATAETQGEYTCLVSNACGTDTSLNAHAEITVGVSGEVAYEGYVLGTPIPNPVIDQVRFSYTIPVPQLVHIVLTNAVGQVVAELQNGYMPNGNFSISFSASSLNLTPGVYNYMIQAGGFAAAQQVVVVR